MHSDLGSGRQVFAKFRLPISPFGAGQLAITVPPPHLGLASTISLILASSFSVQIIRCVLLPCSHEKHAHELFSPRYFTGVLQSVAESAQLGAQLAAAMVTASG